MRGTVLFSVIVSVLDIVKNCDAQRKSVALPFWANEAVFGPLQNAFENVNRGGNGVYVLLWATYNNDPAALGQQFKCVVTYNTKRNALDYTLRSHFKFRNIQSGTTYRKTRIMVKAVKYLGYRHIRNALQLEKDGKKFTNVLIFSNGRNCDVFLVPKHKNGCELWVREDWVKKLPLCCVFIYKMCALGKPTYAIYTAEECGRKQGSAAVLQQE
uniref:Putative group vi salivary lipocalin n=1 Tax=Rhipicephalus pulchellus TaxID=72859 RepID=L7LQW1_RHIPC